MPTAKNVDAVIAAFDVGSNSIKITVARRDPTGAVEEFAWDSETVRLGMGLGQSGRLAPDRLDAAAATISRFAAQARAAGATRLLGVATAAIRSATNGPDFLERVRQEAGVEITVVSGDREAELTFRGLAAAIGVSGHILVADIGGGSTELIDALDGRVRAARSIPLGSGHLTDAHVHSDPPTSAELACCRAGAAAQLATVTLPGATPPRLVVGGGTGEYLVRLVPADRPTTPAAVVAVLDRLTTIPAAVLAEKISIPEARARVLPAGIAIVQAIADRTHPPLIQGARSGIRTGLLMAAFAGEI